MGLFGQNSPFEADIEKATSEKNTSEPWNLIMDICDKVTSNPKNVKDCLRSILKRIGHQDPHVVLQAITLLDACVKNCGKQFHLEVASREFETEYRKLLMKAPPPVAAKMRQTIKKWKDNEFKNDPQLALIPSFYQKLKSEGHDFSEQKQPKPTAAQAAALKDPNIVTSQQEEEDIAKAIELSLKETKNSPKKQVPVSSSTTNTYPSLYPSFSGSPRAIGNSGNSLSSASSTVEPRKVRALYDFEAAEENEMTFVKGEIIHVLDDTDPNWWKGHNQRGQGLFPSNFVTADLSVEPEQLDLNQQQKSKKVQFEDEINSVSASKKDEKTDLLATDLENLTIQTEINEEKIDRLLHLLHEANPEDPSKDTDEMLRLEEEVNQMGPLIDAELELVDRKHAQLTQLSSDLVDAINLYHTLMREPPISSPAHMNYFTNPMATNMYNQPQPNMYNPSQPIPMQFGMQPVFHMPGNIGGNQAMALPLMQQIPAPNIATNSIPAMITGTQQQIHHNIPGAFYDNSNISNQQMQQLQQNQHQINAVPYQNDQRPNNIQNTQQQIHSLQQIQQGSAPQSVTNNPLGQQGYMQQTGQPVTTGTAISHQQMMTGPSPQHNNILQQTQVQNQQLAGLPTNVVNQQPIPLGSMPIGNNGALQANSQNMVQHSNGICSIPVGTLSHINSNINNTIIPNPQMQHTMQASSINSTMPHLSNPTQFSIGMTQNLNQNMLMQNDTKTNIPIYQQR
ncbi:signal transducing adapter molecule 1 [Condylostylus longicornis]|uniref:signal transducing adapter molecule 1 n=1 Tax=Condylostylus longicornis TaxID=2530218 RepID=UPI00244DEC6B|nr:signal transducing adapter molecule 1 [Condylostylus longicornis]